MADSVKQRNNKFDWLKEHQWQKGQSGNPKGRPKEKTLKEFARNFLANMSEDARIEYLKSVDPRTVWEMSEGKPKQDLDISATITMANILDELENDTVGQTVTEQGVEATASLQDPGQTEESGEVQSEQSTETLQPEQVEPELNSEV